MFWDLTNKNIPVILYIQNIIIFEENLYFYLQLGMYFDLSLIFFLSTDWIV